MLKHEAVALKKAIKEIKSLVNPAQVFWLSCRSKYDTFDLKIGIVSCPKKPYRSEK
ncbi:hypothetical protein [Microseira sp. BLCC-F43]|jgi:hypothetical protein|uniref:hypothetical protein n=1 Tax=Microseira sp. BLCC-F43 TaxID=3153602 RepID=UPI0035B8FCC4